MKNGMSMRYKISYLKYKTLSYFIVLNRGFRIGVKKIRKKPYVLQLPITYLCNFDCVMCGMHHMIYRKDFTAAQLGEIVSDPLFSDIKKVGINGGEPFLRSDLVECIEQMIKNCPHLEEFNIISNGYFTERIVRTMEILKQLCKKHDIRLNLSISIDGINDMQDFHRGRKYAFENAILTIKEIKEDIDRYVDRLQCICTLTKYNIERINEVDVWSQVNGIEMSYNLATVNVRIENEDRFEDFSVFSDEHARMLTEEFFYSKYLETNLEKYFGLYLFVKEGKRYADCPCQFNEWVTLTPDGNIGYCATHSKSLGCAYDRSSYKIFNENKIYLKELINSNCSGCSHYLYSLNAKGLKRLRDDERDRIYVRGRV